jgi:6-phosphogluconolactonase
VATCKTPEVEVFPEPEDVARAATEAFVADVEAAVEATGRCYVALSGGSTPRGLYERLAHPGTVERVDWDRVHVFWGDERCVPPYDPDSDYLMAKEALLDRVPLREGQVHRIRGEADPAEAAAEYERLLRRAFGAPQGPPAPAPGARFDLVLLGMGEDGHTASLFPGSAAIHETERWVVPTEAPAAPRRRVSFTPPLINAAATKRFLVTGVAKAPVVASVLEGSRDLDRYPAQVVEDAEWLLDSAAASMLSG